MTYFASLVAAIMVALFIYSIYFWTQVIVILYFYLIFYSFDITIFRFLIFLNGDNSV